MNERETTWWLVVGEDAPRVFMVWSGGGRAFPVFSFREEAEMFARIESGAGWAVREVTTTDLLLALRETPAHVERVCLDPLPSIVGGGILGLVSLSRRRFEEMLLSRGFPFCGPRFEEHT